MAPSTHTGALSILCLLSAFALLPLASSRAFLGYDSKLQATAFRAELQEMIVEALGHGHSISLDRLNKINSTVEPIFSSLPKNRQGRVAAPSMRHVLQRYFGDERGWIVKGFEPHAANTSDSGVGKLMMSKLPGYAKAVIEKEISNDGFTLHDTVSAVIVVEEIIFDEALHGLRTAYNQNGLVAGEPLSRMEMIDILESFAMLEILEGKGADETHHEHLDRKIRMTRLYPNWNLATMFLDDLANDHGYQQRHSGNPFSERQYDFEDAARVAQDFSQEFGRFSNHECEDLKDALVEIDTYATGRVRLADFHKLSEGGAWNFIESADYLRQNGALDESSAGLGPQVMIPNYVTGMSNCITSNHNYASCCRNECLTLQRTLEGHIRAPVADASEIVRSVELMSSPTQDARNLSLPLRARLDEVATFHGGKVPLHGRLFAQWFHFAFPRECPFPHMSGTLNPLTMREHADASDGLPRAEAFHLVASGKECSGAKTDKGQFSTAEECSQACAATSPHSTFFIYARQGSLVPGDCHCEFPGDTECTQTENENYDLYSQASYRAAASSDCPADYMITAKRECEDAGAALGRQLAVLTGQAHLLPPGCYWNSVHPTMIFWNPSGQASMDAEVGTQKFGGVCSFASHRNSKHAPASPEAGTSMWSLHEELIATHEVSEARFDLRSIMRTCALLVMAVSLVLLVAKHLAHVWDFVSPAGQTDRKEYLV